MNLKKIRDFADCAHREIGKYRLTVTLSPDKMMMNQYDVDVISWESILYGKSELAKIPDNKRGIYAFAICHENKVLPPHTYVLYIGIAGKDSDRSLRERYKDYLNECKILKRPGITRMIADWQPVLRFYFASVDENVSSEELKRLERQLNTALMPPFSEGDLEADTRRKRKAFK